MVWKASFVLFLVFVNGFFVAAEFALVKVRLGEIRLLARAGSRTARIVESVVMRLDTYLSACQLGITLASLGLGWVGEPLVANSLEPIFETLGLPSSKVHLVAMPIAFFLITFLHIAAGEQFPKMLAIQKYQSTALVVGVPLKIFYIIFQPFIWLLNNASNLMLRVVGIHAASEHGDAPTEEQLRVMLIESVAGGHVTRRERRIIENVLDLEEKVARRFMVPRNQIIFIDRNEPMREKLLKAAESGRTRLPICDGDLDHLIGVVHVKDIFRAIASSTELDTLVSVAREPLFLPELITLEKMLREFQKAQTQIAMLIDEYGALSGMITLEDVLEELVGPIQDEFDDHTPMIVKKGPDEYELDGMCPVDQAIYECRLILPKKTEAATIGGLVTDLIGHIPLASERTFLGDHEIVILAAEPTRIHRLLIRKRQTPTENDPEYPITDPS